jgi:hypothetical protein
MSVVASTGGGTYAPLGGRRSVASATLCVPELLDAVLSYCRQKDLAAAARVSRLWFEHAIDVLWWHIHGLEPIIHLFQTLFHIEEEFVLEPVLRFLQYRRRVRSFTLSTTVHLEISPDKLDLWKILLKSSWRDGFPNLRYLDWTPIPHKPFQVATWVLFVSPFMNSAVEDLRIYVPFSQGALHSHDLAALPFMFTAMSRMVALTYLEFRMDISVQTCEAELVQLLHQLKNLRDLHLPGYWNTSRVLEAISEMPHLCGFQSVVDETSGVGSRADMITVRPALRQGAFAELSSLSLCASLEDVLSLLGDVHGPRLSDLMVQSANFSESPAQVHRFLTQLNDLAPNLEDLTLELRIYSRDAPFMSMSDSNVIPLSLVDIQPIASLPKLRGLVLYHARPLNLSEHDLEELLKKLPCITHLRLGSEPFVKPAPQESTLTCAALAIAARYCTRLEALGLFIDTLPPSIPATNTAASDRFAYLAELDMGCSILDSREVHEMGEYLDHILPPGCTLSYGLAWEEGYLENSLTIEVDRSEENWEAVSKLLEVGVSC